MALEDIIAQRIAALASMRTRLDASNYGLVPLREGLQSMQEMAFRREQEGRVSRQGEAQLAFQRAQAEAEAARHDETMRESGRRFDESVRQFDIENAPVPEGLRRPLAESVVPAAPQMPDMGAGAGYAPGLPVVQGVLDTQRRGQVDALVSALGAQGAAKLLASISVYYSKKNQNDEVALARLGLARAGLDLAVEREGRIAGDKAEAATREQGEKAAADAWWGQYGKGMVEGGALPEGAIASMPEVYRKSFFSQERIDARTEAARQAQTEWHEEQKRRWASDDEWRKRAWARGNHNDVLDSLNTEIDNYSGLIAQNLDPMTGKPKNANKDAVWNARKVQLMQEYEEKRKEPITGGPALKAEAPGVISPRRRELAEKVRNKTATPAEQDEYERLIEGK